MYCICRRDDPGTALEVFVTEAEARQRLERHGAVYLPALGHRPIPIGEMMIVRDPPPTTD